MNVSPPKQTPPWCGCDLRGVARVGRVGAKTWLMTHAAGSDSFRPHVAMTTMEQNELGSSVDSGQFIRPKTVPVESGTQASVIQQGSRLTGV